MDIVKEQLSGIVGKDNIVFEPGDLKSYGEDNISFIPPRYPLLAVRPGTVEEIQGVLKVASLNKIPVTPFSSNSNGHGASIPSIPGITIDLRRLNRIHLIDETSRNAIIEPGVTFAQLQEKAREKGLRTLVPIELPCDSSVVSAYVEMTPLYTWPKYGTESILTMEVLLPNGDLLKTGIAAVPLIETPYFPFGTTPSYFNKVWFGSQGTLGIVTKAIVKIKTLYEAKEVLLIPFNRFEESFSVIREIKRLDSPVEFFIADAPYFAGLLSEDNKDFSALKHSIPPVTAVLVLRGEKEQVQYQKADLEDLAKKMDLELLGALPGDKEAVKKLLDEVEQPRGYKRFKKIKGAYGVIPFICMARQIPMFNQVVSRISKGLNYDQKDIGSMLLPVEPSRVHFQYSFYTDPSNQQEYMKVKKLFESISTTLIRMGAFFSRPYGEWARLVYEKASGYKAMLRMIKKEVDPENIMNPGKLNL